MLYLAKILVFARLGPCKELTPKAKERYLKSSDDYCPYCGAQDIEGGAIEVDGGCAWQKIQCHACRVMWLPQSFGEIMEHVPNGIQLVSKPVLQHGLTQCTTCFSHEREGFGPPLFDPRLDTVGPRGIDE